MDDTKTNEEIPHGDKLYELRHLTAAAHEVAHAERDGEPMEGTCWRSGAGDLFAQIERVEATRDPEAFPDVEMNVAYLTATTRRVHGLDLEMAELGAQLLRRGGNEALRRGAMVAAATAVVVIGDSPSGVIGDPMGVVDDDGFTVAHLRDLAESVVIASDGRQKVTDGGPASARTRWALTCSVYAMQLCVAALDPEPDPLSNDLDRWKTYMGVPLAGEATPLRPTDPIACDWHPPEVLRELLAMAESPLVGSIYCLDLRESLAAGGVDLIVSSEVSAAANCGPLSKIAAALVGALPAAVRHLDGSAQVEPALRALRGFVGAREGVDRVQRLRGALETLSQIEGEDPSAAFELVSSIGFALDTADLHGNFPEHDEEAVEERVRVLRAAAATLVREVAVAYSEMLEQEPWVRRMPGAEAAARQVHDALVRGLRNSAEVERFDRSWRVLAAGGACDAHGGMEHERVLSGWMDAGYPADVVTFIRERANVGPIAAE